MHALRVIEFDRIRDLLAQACDTPAGAALAAEITPRFDADGVEFEIERTREADHLLALQSVTLAGLKDVAAAVRLCEKGGVVDAVALHGVGASLEAMRGAKAVLEPKRGDMPRLWLLGDRLPRLEGLENRLLTSLDGDGTVRDEASADLAAARSRKARAAQRILERIQSYVSGRTRDLLSDPLYTVRGGRYVIPLKAEHKGKVKGIVHDTSGSGATVYVEPEDVVGLGNQLRQAEAAERAEVERVLADLSGRVGRHGREVRDGLEAGAELDLVLAKARLGRGMGGCVPTRSPGAFIKLTEARHPLLPRDSAVPLSLQVGGEIDVLLITGPNTGGKTVAIKTVGLCVAMAQCGMMPTAAEARVGLFTQMWADIGDEQSLQQSLSTFSGHIKNISAALNELRPGALVLLDEVGAGTDPAEGAALARALLTAFQTGGAKVMASTHYGELKVLASQHPGFLNAAMEFDLKSLRPTFRLMVGVPGSSHALRIAERFGVPKPVLELAQAGIGQESLDVARMIERLETAQKQAQRAQGEADRLAGRLRAVEREAEEQIARAEEARRRVREQAATELEEVLREIRIEAAELFDALKRDPSQAGFDRARQRLKGLQEVGGEFVRDLRPDVPTPDVRPESGKLTKGALVKVAGLGQTGVLLEDPKGGKAPVQLGPLKMTIEVARLEPVVPARAPKASGQAARQQLAKGMAATTEIQLRQMRAEDAAEALERFLDESVLGGVPSVRIVHGKGGGVLRKVTREVLRRHPSVQGYRDGEPEEGGQGVTIATFK